MKPWERVIKIGNQAALSGDYEVLGFDQTVSASIAVAELSPVEIGGFTYKIDLVSKDDQGDPEKAFLVAQELAELDVSAVIGSTFNGTTKVSIPVYQEYRIPLITAYAQGDDLSGLGDNFFRMVISNQQRVENIANVLVNQLKPEKLILIDNRSEYSANLVDYLAQLLREQGVEITRRYSIDFSTEGYEIIAENLLLDKPDYIFACTEYDQLASLITKAREAGIDSSFVTDELAMDDQISVLADPEVLEGLIAIVSEPPTIARFTENKKAVDFWYKYTDYAETMDNELATEPGKYAPYAYDAVNIVIAAMKKANSIMPMDYMDELKSISYDGVVGHIEFGDNGNRLDPASTLFKYTNGAWARY
ncbi:MAG: branched-chain amino acid ABC transporter substrate-binding protein [Actinomycetota bacterium]|nr:branched-chain amino acid ABC transporter substrate-binding protein [Actinomycetota bacterium]